MIIIFLEIILIISSQSEEPKVHEELLQPRLPIGEPLGCSAPEDYCDDGDDDDDVDDVNYDDDDDDKTMDMAYPRASCW